VKRLCFSVCSIGFSCADGALREINVVRESNTRQSVAVMLRREQREHRRATGNSKDSLAVNLRVRSNVQVTHQSLNPIRQGRGESMKTAGIVGDVPGDEGQEGLDARVAAFKRYGLSHGLFPRAVGAP